MIHIPAKQRKISAALRFPGAAGLSTTRENPSSIESSPTLSSEAVFP